MKLHELLTESLSRIVYHYTNVASAAKILQTGEFQLSSTLGSIEQSYAPKGKNYFLSTTRTKTGGYHDYVGSTAAMFVLNGDWFNQHYVSRPVDYWENRDPKKMHNRASEAEDRIFSSSPAIPIGGVSEVHILGEPDAQDYMSAYVRKALLAAKKRGIPVYFYEDQASWRMMDKSKSVQIKDRPSLRGQEGTRRGYDRKGYLAHWVELITKDNKNQLSKKARDVWYDLAYGRYLDGLAKSLSVDLSNARKPSSGMDRENCVKIIEFMRRNKLNSVQDFVNFLSEKWKNI